MRDQIPRRDIVWSLLKDKVVLPFIQGKDGSGRLAILERTLRIYLPTRRMITSPSRIQAPIVTSRTRWRRSTSIRKLAWPIFSTARLGVTSRAASSSKPSSRRAVQRTLLAMIPGRERPRPGRTANLHGRSSWAATPSLRRCVCRRTSGRKSRERSSARGR